MDLMSRATRVVVAGAVAAAAVVLGGASPSVSALDKTPVPGQFRIVDTKPVRGHVPDRAYIRSTWRAKRITEGTTLITKVKRCDGTWDTRRVPYVTGSFVLNIASRVAHGFPRSAPVKGILVHPDYKRTVTYSGRLTFGRRFGRC
jgi:hypothetical protein